MQGLTDQVYRIQGQGRCQPRKVGWKRDRIDGQKVYLTILTSFLLRNEYRPEESGMDMSTPIHPVAPLLFREGRNGSYTDMKLTSHPRRQYRICLTCSHYSVTRVSYVILQPRYTNQQLQQHYTTLDLSICFFSVSAARIDLL